MGGDYFLDQMKGVVVIVKKIDLHPVLGGGFTVYCEPEGETPETMRKLGVSELKIFSDQLSPLDIEIPKNLIGHEHMVACWAFVEARNDAWARNPPKDIQAWEKENDMKWKDIRVFDVERGYV